MGFLGDKLSRLVLYFLQSERHNSGTCSGVGEEGDRVTCPFVRLPVSLKDREKRLLCQVTASSHGKNISWKGPLEPLVQTSKFNEVAQLLRNSGIFPGL